MNRNPIPNYITNKKNIQILQASRDYCKTKSLSIYFDCFYLKPEDPQGKIILNVLKANQFLFDDRYKEMDTTVDPGFQLKCCQCKNVNYDSWKLIGSAVDLPKQIMKVTLPYVMCEYCYRKCFNGTIHPKYVCGVAVLPSIEYPAQIEKVTPVLPAIKNSQPLPSVDRVVRSTASPAKVSHPILSQAARSKPAYAAHPIITSTPPAARPPPHVVNQVPQSQSQSQSQIQPLSQISQPSQIPPPPSQISQPQLSPSQIQPQLSPSQISQPPPSQPSQPQLSPSQPSQPSQPQLSPLQPSQPSQPQLSPSQPSQPSPSSSPLINTPSNYSEESGLEEETQQTEEDTSPAESIEDELCFQLPFRQGGFFRTWLPSYFVLTTYSICMYPNEKRNEKKKKEILLCDAMVANSPVHTDSRHKFCVSIQPGRQSEQQKAFVVAFKTKEEEDEFINLVNRYISIAKQNQYHYYSFFY